MSLESSLENLQTIISKLGKIIESLQNSTQKIDGVISSIKTCQSCHQLILEDGGPVYYFDHPYHKGCAKCQQCGETKNLKCIGLGYFLCMEHFYEKKVKNDLSEKEKAEIKKELKENFADSLFDNTTSFNGATTSFNGATTCISKDKPYIDYIANTECTFDKPLKDIKIDKLPEVFGDDAAILDINPEGKMATIITFALLSCATLEPEEIVTKSKEYIDNLRERLRSSIEHQAVIGNLTNSKINIPNDKKMEKDINKQHYNQLQCTIELEKEDIVKIRKRILEKLKTNKVSEDWRFIICHQEIYKELEDQLRVDLAKNPYELILIGQSLITSKYFGDFVNIKEIIPEKVVERYLYHGTKYENHAKIAENHFLNPNQDDMSKIKTNDDGFYGKGMYFTDNVFYASFYANGYRRLNVGDSTHILSSRAIYNNGLKRDMFENVDSPFNLSHYGKKIDEDVIKNYGVNYVLVGDEKFFLPIKKEDIDRSDIYAYEFVFAHSGQVIPCYSCEIMRTDHYILWKDENIHNTENSRYLNDLSKSIQVNIYSKTKVEDAIKVVKTKKYAALKLITNAGRKLREEKLLEDQLRKEKLDKVELPEEKLHDNKFDDEEIQSDEKLIDENADADKYTGQILIEKAREIIGSNFVCMVFATQESHMEWVSKMENVLFTTDPLDFKEFAALKMDIIELRVFIKKLREKYQKNGYKFKINEKELLHYPNCDQKDVYYLKYYENDGHDENAFKKIFKKMCSSIKSFFKK